MVEEELPQLKNGNAVLNDNHYTGNTTAIVTTCILISSQLCVEFCPFVPTLHNTVKTQSWSQAQEVDPHHSRTILLEVPKQLKSIFDAKHHDTFSVYFCFGYFVEIWCYVCRGSQ